ncbi:MAG: RnfABCDGE type electron transport complex subunit D, partial [Lachnospiraceae bacterium]|nr:RnfABCDGE type electron transport complex subunit D [Lachnospiraceae bacterium]
MSKLMNVSSSPHVRSKLTTRHVMCDVILALLPATVMGVYHFGISALVTILTSIAAAVLTEFLFDKATGRENTITDCSAIVTGLLLALCLPNGVPLYIPVLGSVFAILFTKCCFGGLGHNFMNPALSGRCFLLISFAGVMSTYTVDGVSSATPLADLASGNAVNLVQTFLGANNGVIGCSTAGLLLGGIYLLIVGGITWEIPVSVLVSFTAFIALFGGHGFDVQYLLMQLAGGGIVMGAFFMATDPVTCPLGSGGQLLYGVVLGILAALFRVFGSSADSVSYAIIICNMFVPLIDEISIPTPFGYRKKKEGGKKIPAAAIALCVITLIAGVALSGVYKLTEGRITEQKLAEKSASYQEVCPD